MSNLRKHTKADRVKWIIVTVVLIAIIGALATFGIKLSRQTTTTTIGGERYEIGCLSEVGAETDDDTSIRLRNTITCDGLTVEIDEDAKVTYKLFFYDEKGDFLSATEELSTDFDTSSVPEGAESVKVQITPTADEDGKVTISEVLGYANQITVTVNR